MGHCISTVEQLESLYDAPSRRAVIKELAHLSSHYRAFIEASPFVVLATIGAGGLDCSPRGDPPGFVRVVDERTLLLPDRRGNNRIDSLRNLVEDPRISLLFMIPGVGETLRVNGTAEITTEPETCASLAMNEQSPTCVIRVTIDRVYFQCQKALTRSKLWSDEARVERSSLPTAGDMLKEIDASFDGETYDAEYPERMKRTLY